ncbi:hypothetical protein B0H17DRAFT_1212059 [Mycena rosella]|uniref:DUF6699 domain-containing protein n=1 Tax=Mycena rosella TaxID=1033263 RepID=A0AAD7CTG3_MYCRO|nr:hypothetical protein B0H17DRAFT_1212059 [Mycena rosella]
MDFGPPPLVDYREGGGGGGMMIPPPAGAVMGGNPIHGAFPGYNPHQQRQQAPPPNWWQGAAAQTPWATGGGGWTNTPASGSGWGSGWANTPAPMQAGWAQQQQAPWAPPVRQGWGPAAQGGMTPAASWPGTPWDRWGEPPPQSAPASLHGFGALAAPPEREQPVTQTSWFGPAAAAEARYRGGTPAPAGYELEEGEEYCDYDALDAAEAAEAAGRGGHAHAHAQEWDDPRDPWMRQQREMAAWAAQGQQHDPRAAWPRGWSQEELALTRAHSLGGTSLKKKKNKRSHSVGLGGWGAQGHTAFDEHHLSHRPDDWRDGYSPRTGIGADLSFSSFFRKKTADSSEFADPKKRELSRPLVYNASKPHIAFDMRRPPEETSFFGAFRPTHARDMAQPAVTPAATRMRLVHSRLPWYVDVRRAQGITLYDILRALFDELNLPISGRDFWNEELGRRERDSLTSAFKERCGLDGREHAKEEMSKGVKRVDFLGPEVIFVGLARRNGMWEIKTANGH